VKKLPGSRVLLIVVIGLVALGAAFAMSRRRA